MDPAAMCLALNMFFEARDQGVDGMLMVAEVTMNRVADHRYPDEVCDVVWQPKQFSWTHDGLSDDPERFTGVEDRAAWDDAMGIAMEVMRGEADLVGSEANHYHAKDVQPYWADEMVLVGAWGDHVFYIWR